MGPACIDGTQSDLSHLLFKAESKKVPVVSGFQDVLVDHPFPRESHHHLRRSQRQVWVYVNLPCMTCLACRMATTHVRSEDFTSLLLMGGDLPNVRLMSCRTGRSAISIADPAMCNRRAFSSRILRESLLQPYLGRLSSGPQ